MIQLTKSLPGLQLNCGKLSNVYFWSLGGDGEMTKLQIISDRNDIIPVIQDAIAARVKRTEIGFQKTEKEIQKFEKKYRISSDDFLAEYTSDDLSGGDEDYISWMGEIKLREALLEEIKALREIEYVC
jgi:hypothetical protein